MGLISILVEWLEVLDLFGTSKISIKTPPCNACDATEANCVATAFGRPWAVVSAGRWWCVSRCFLLGGGAGVGKFAQSDRENLGGESVVFFWGGENYQKIITHVGIWSIHTMLQNKDRQKKQTQPPAHQT